MAKPHRVTPETRDDAGFAPGTTLGTGTLAAIIQQTPRVHTRCRLCKIILGLDDDTTRGLCLDCQTRPEAIAGKARPPAKPASAPPPAPAFSIAERSLIRSVASFMPTLDLLRVINERRAADLGPGAVPHAIEQLDAAIRELTTAKETGTDWSGLRRLLGQARRSGVLTSITPQLVDDFATVFQLAPAQLMHLRDVIRHAQEGR